ncbi:hypothetical protein I7I50_05052 [Histoplasma capsulatum G186AR]|uniref:Uncharacterized protein n=1 Tax=Ajellomyces capsulatus TaxID=5037 RepID=A0A8H8D9R1_AJECA|nr:hypothetical protein I7I52_03310 [Histoplasma capsulatum]QSS75792.1 hypothetical protein I7I50_05052 [Histoplasma capsulatum G186AR]
MSMSMSMDDALRVKKLKEEKQMRLSRFCAPKEKQEDFYRYLESLKIKKMPQYALLRHSFLCKEILCQLSRFP